MAARSNMTLLIGGYVHTLRVASQNGFMLQSNPEKVCKVFDLPSAHPFRDTSLNHKLRTTRTPNRLEYRSL
jgi:hypothetical protein